MNTLETGYLTIARVSGDPAVLAEAFERAAPVMNGVGRDHGLLVHVGAVTDDGFVIVNLWPEKGASDVAARDSRRAEQLAASGLRPSSITREHHAVTQAVLF
jgi:hypothetical protein